jgi:polyhydroxyalkanoate depolymerase
MLYQAYQASADALLPLRAAAETAMWIFDQKWPGIGSSAMQRSMAAAWALFARTRLTHHRPAFGIDSTVYGTRTVAVVEERIRETPFCTLIHFKKDLDLPQPRVLLVAPMSGHFATLLRHTIRTMLPDHDIYVTDWRNARDVALSAGRFGFDDFIGHIIDFVETLGPNTHLLGVCQPAVAVLAAAALMAQNGSHAQPASMTLMAGPVDTRLNPTRVNRLATERPIEWFEANLISRVPFCHAGAFRRVYPGFVQLAAFMAMNFDRHIDAFRRHFDDLVNGDERRLRAHQAFYDEYFAVMDLPAEFYLETVERVFQRQELAQGTLSWRGQRVEPAAIRRTALLTVEGENDDICAIGQTLAAQELCTGLHPSKKRHHLQTGVGHYGVFSGRRWVAEIYPRVRELIWSNN